MEPCQSTWQDSKMAAVLAVRRSPVTLPNADNQWNFELRLPELIADTLAFPYPKCSNPYYLRVISNSSRIRTEVCAKVLLSASS
jgi:hypothetical protein